MHTALASTKNATPRVVDNDRDEITVTLDGKEIRGWSYGDNPERRVKMLLAREFVEGWFQCAVHLAEPTEAMLEAVDFDISVNGIVPDSLSRKIFRAMLTASQVAK